MNRHFLSLRSAGLHTALIAVCGLGLVLGSPTQPTAFAQDAEAETATDLPEGHFAPTREAMPFNLVTADDTRVGGKIMTYTAEAIHYLDHDDAEQSVAWSAFKARDVERFYPRLIESADIEGWYRLVELLAGLDEGKDPAERVMRRVERMDPENEDRHTEMRSLIASGGRAPAAGDGDEEGDGVEGEGVNGDGLIQQDDNPRAWPELTDEEQAAATERLETNMKDALEQIQMPMGNTQTERFIVFTDLPRNEARNWVGVLDRLYDRMCGIFDLDSDVNLWQGKCVFVLFNDVQDYYKFSAQVFGFNAQGSGGYCSLRDGGDIYIVMYKHRDEDYLATVLVHEASHAFLFRYKSSFNVPNWLHEGLAEYLVEVLLNNGNAEARLSGARRYVQQRGRLDNFLSARNIIGPHYGIAYDITDLMIDENKRGYVDMIQGIKEGMSVEEAFDERYGASLETVVRYYGRTRLRIDNLPMN
ncbi:hypothetical protein OT109_05045 [Phycisphaeraceae bacterium D3-23]